MLPRPGHGGGDRPKLHLIAMVWGVVGLVALVVSVVATNVAVAIFGGLALVAAVGAYAVQNARDRSAAETERTLAGGPSMAPGDLSAPPPRMSMGRLLGTEDPGVGGGRARGPSTRADMDGVAEALDPFSGRSGPASHPVDPLPSDDPTPSEAAGPGPDADDAAADEGSVDDGSDGVSDGGSGGGSDRGSDGGSDHGSGGGSGGGSGDRSGSGPDDGADRDGGGAAGRNG